MSYEGSAGRTMLTRQFCSIAVKTGTHPIQLVSYDVSKPDLMLAYENENLVKEEISSGFPHPDAITCQYCAVCVDHCQRNALKLDRSIPALLVNPERCEGCGRCMDACPTQGLKFRKRFTGSIYCGHGKGTSLLFGKANESHDFLIPLIRAVNDRLDAHSLAICDCSPGDSGYVRTSIRGSSYAVILINPSVFTLENLRIMQDMLHQDGIPHGVVVNKYRNEVDYLKMVAAVCEKSQVPLLGTIPFCFELIDQKTCSSDGMNPEMEAIFAAIWEAVIMECKIQ